MLASELTELSGSGSGVCKLECRGQLWLCPIGWDVWSAEYTKAAKNPVRKFIGVVAIVFCFQPC
jgi:hypothetical protein